MTPNNCSSKMNWLWVHRFYYTLTPKRISVFIHSAFKSFFTVLLSICCLLSAAKESFVAVVVSFLFLYYSTFSFASSERNAIFLWYTHWFQFLRRLIFVSFFIVSFFFFFFVGLIIVPPLDFDNSIESEMSLLFQNDTWKCS